MKSKNSLVKIKSANSISRREVSIFFLGVGIVMFFLNISTFLSFMPSSYSFFAFDISILTSMVLIIFTTYMLVA